MAYNPPRTGNGLRRLSLSLLLVLGLALLAPGCHAAGARAALVPAPAAYLSKFQCWNSVDMAGYIVTDNYAPNANDCARQCLATSGCSAFTQMRSNRCLVKILPFDAAFGTTGVNSTVSSSCLLKSNGGSLPSPADIMCFTGQSVAGFSINNLVPATTSQACAALCVSTAGCSFSVFWIRGTDGASGPLCQLKTNPFVGGPAADTFKSPLVTSICFRAIPAPQVYDPLVAVAGPVPFLIQSRSTGRCLRVRSSPYSSGQVPVFMSDCSSGAEGLWTYSTDTQVLTHYASGLCLVPSDVSSGATAVLSSACASTPANQVHSTISGWIQVSQGFRWLQPGVSPTSEGAVMLAKTSVPADQLLFIPVPGQAFQCYSRVNITGDVISSSSNVNNADACAALCLSSAYNCTSFIFQAPNPSSAGTCTLQTNSFAGGSGGVTWASSVAAACINKATAASLPSPANTLCYANQHISGVVLQSLPLANPQLCINACAATPQCTYAMYAVDGTCTIGRQPFFGPQGNAGNVQDPNVLELCLVAKGAPDTVYSKGYTCFPGTDIAGDLVGTALQVPSAEACSWKCEAMSDLCSLAIYTNTQLCILMQNPFAGQFGATGASPSKTACLRAQSGGPINSPGDFLCYPSQNIGGTLIGQGAGVSDSASCAAVCAATPSCTASVYQGSVAGTCSLKKDAFSVNSDNRLDYSVSGMCLRAPGAPPVTSGFGSNGAGSGMGGGGMGMGSGSGKGPTTSTPVAPVYGGAAGVKSKRV